MADVYYDPGASGTNLGTSWINAYETIDLALNGSNVGAGDTLWCKNNKTDYGAITLKGPATFTNDPPRVIGCISATTNTPPVAADIVPGLRNGSSTRAYDQTAGNAAPIIATSVAGSDLLIEGYFGLIYGIVLKGRDDLSFGSNEYYALVEECELRSSDGEAGNIKLGVTATAPQYNAFKNCKFSDGSNGEVSFLARVGDHLFEGCEFNMPFTSFIKPGEASAVFSGCDFTSQTIAIIDNAGGIRRSPMCFYNCIINGSSALTTGSIAQEFRVEFIQTSSVTGKTTGGSFLELDIITNHGNIVVETTRFRTGGADDGGDGPWSLAFTPSDNGTRTNLVGLEGPLIHQKIAGDGTAQTLTVFIANDLAEDAGNTYDDEDVWLEVQYPSEGGTADYDNVTTQMDLLGTPSEITTETDSTWGSGANNRQKLSLAISPDYTGRLRWRVVFAKNFASSADTLYVDPASEIT